MYEFPIGQMHGSPEDAYQMGHKKSDNTDKRLVVSESTLGIFENNKVSIRT